MGKGSEFEKAVERIEELARQVEALRERVVRLEGRGEEGGHSEGLSEAVEAPLVHPLENGPPSAESRGEPALSSQAIPLVGRTLVVLGGAYLFRAVSDRELVPPLLGACAALTYALFWLWRCDRAALRQQPISAAFHGVTAMLIAYPLLWETTARFDLIQPVTASAALAVTFTLAVGTGTRHSIPALVWTAVTAHLVTGFALLFGTHAFLPLSLAFLAACAVVEVPRVGGRWTGLREVVAMGSDAALLVLMAATLTRASRGADADPIGPGVVPALLSLPLLYVISVAERTLRRGRPISSFEVLQVALTLALGVVGGVWVERAAGGSATPIGAIALLLGAAAYAAGFTFINRRQGRGRNFYAFTTFALGLMLVGFALVLGPRGPALVASWSALSLVSVGVGVRFDRITLRFHGAAYAIAAALASGLVATAAEGLVAAPAAWRPLTATALFAGAVAAGVTAALIATRSPAAAWYTRLPHAALVALLVLLIAGLTARALSSPWIALFGEGSVPAFLAALRSVLLALLALALAAAGRRWQLYELNWIVYPMLGICAVKLLWEDLSVGEPVALFLAFVVYGGTLIAIPRMLRPARAS